MADSFEHALDRCLDRINAGERIEACLADFPEHAAQLEPLLREALRTRDAYSFTPSAQAKQAALQRFAAAREQARVHTPERRRGPFAFFSRPIVWGPVLGVIVALLVTFFAVQPALSPDFLPITPVASANGNFVFLISDDVNAIADFTSVNVTFSQIGLLDAASGKWLPITPEITSIDLTRVQGDATEQVWRGDVPAGKYDQVFIYVDNVTGILKADNSTVGIKLPSNKLHVKISFEVSDDTVTAFAFDLTVVNAGKGNDRDKYVLKPVLAESGVRRSPVEPTNSSKDNDRTGPPPRLTPTKDNKSRSTRKDG